MLYGGHCQDNIYGELGDDFLNGDEGNDSLIGGAGDHVLSGELGDDIYFTIMVIVMIEYKLASVKQVVRILCNCQVSQLNKSG